MLKTALEGLRATSRGVCVVDVTEIIKTSLAKSTSVERRHKRFMVDLVMAVEGYAVKAGFQRERRKVMDLHKVLGDVCGTVSRGGHCIVLEGVDDWVQNFGDEAVPVEWVENLKNYNLKVYSEVSFPNPLPPQEYLTAGETSSFSAATTAVELPPRSHGVLITRPTPHTFSVFSNQCPHVGLPLGDGPEVYSEGAIICTAHLAKFNPATGECFQGPCPLENLRRIPYKIIDGKVMIANPKVVHFLATLCTKI